MLTTKLLFKKAMDELIKIFGKEYLKLNYENTCQATGFLDGETYMFFVGIKDKEDFPEREANEKGWVVYAKILLEATTGNVKEVEYALE